MLTMCPRGLVPMHTKRSMSECEAHTSLPNHQLPRPPRPPSGVLPSRKSHTTLKVPWFLVGPSTKRATHGRRPAPFHKAWCSPSPQISLEASDQRVTAGPSPTCRWIDRPSGPTVRACTAPHLRDLRKRPGAVRQEGSTALVFTECLLPPLFGPVGHSLWTDFNTLLVALTSRVPA